MMLALTAAIGVLVGWFGRPLWLHFVDWLETRRIARRPLTGNSLDLTSLDHIIKNAYASASVEHPTLSSISKTQPVGLTDWIPKPPDSTFKPPEMATDLAPFVATVSAKAAKLSLGRRYDDGIWWRLVPLVDEVQCLFTTPTGLHLTVCFAGQMICALAPRPDETAEWVESELRGALAAKTRAAQAPVRE